MAKVIGTLLGFALLFALAVGAKAVQYNFCRSGGLSHGACVAINMR